MRKIVTLLMSSFLGFSIFAVQAATNNPAPANTNTATNASSVTSQKNTITLYENPTTSSKVLATLPQAQALIPIFTQNDWVKVANPQNGDVGWVQKNNLNNATTITVTQQNPDTQQYVITEKNKDGTIKNTYRVIQYSGGNQLSPQQAQAAFDRIRMQQQKMQEDLNKMISDTFRGIGQPVANGVMFQNFPVLPPVIIIQQGAVPSATSANNNNKN